MCLHEGWIQIAVKEIDQKNLRNAGSATLMVSRLFFDLSRGYVLKSEH